MSPSRAALCLALAASGCGVRGSLYVDALAPLPLVPTRSALVQVVPGAEGAVVVSPAERTAARLPLSPESRVVVPIPGADAVAIIGGTGREPVVELLDVAARTVETLSLPGAFDALTFAPGGALAVLSYAGTSGVRGLTARNLNEVAVLDVQARAVSRVSVDAAEAPPRLVVFGPSQPGRQLVAVAFDSAVVLLDARRPELPSRRVALRTAASTQSLSIREALFSRDGRWLFLRAAGLDDVVVLELSGAAGEVVQAQVNFLAGGEGLTDIALPPEGRDDAVLAVFSGSARAVLLDARGIQDAARSVALPPGADVAMSLGGSRYLFMASLAGRSFLAWDAADGRSGPLSLDAPAQAVALVRERLLVSRAFPAGLSSLAVQDEVNRLRVSASSVQLSAALGPWASDGADRLFFSVQNGRVVVTVAGDGLALSELAVDLPVKRLHFLPEGGWVVAEHDDPLGAVTAFPAGATSRAQAQSFSQLALTGALERGGE